MIKTIIGDFLFALESNRRVSVEKANGSRGTTTGDSEDGSPCTSGIRQWSKCFGR